MNRARHNDDTRDDEVLDGWNLLDALSDGLAVIDARGALRWLNASLRRLDRHDHLRIGEDLIACAGPLFPHRDQLDEVARAARDVLGGRHQRVEIECECPEGRRAVVAVTPCPVAGQRGAMLQLVDATARTCADVAVLESEARWRHLVEGSPDIVFITDASSRMIYANRALEEQTGYTVTDFQMAQAQNRFIHPHDQERIATFLGDFVASGRTYSDQVENRFVTKKGAVLWISSVVSRTLYQGQAALQFVCHNVTVEKRAEEESTWRLAEAQEAVRSRDEFLSVAAHELKTPLTSLRGYAQLLMASRAPDPALLSRALNVIDRQITKLAHLIDHLLDLSRLEDGRLVLDRQSADLVPLAREVIATARRPGSGEIQLASPATLPAIVDPLRLEQVITNLLENARRYGPPDGTIRVELRSSHRHAEIAVIDQGPGIPPADRERIFERCYRIPGSHTGGLGLGLYISREIVHLHGGQIAVEPAEGGGARFRVMLPIGGER